MSMKLTATIWRACLSFLLCLLLGYLPVQASETKELTKLAEILTLSDNNNAEALRQLKAFKQALPADTSYAVRIETLKTLVSLYYDAGKIKSSDAAVAELLQLAEEHGDKDGVAIARIAASYKAIDDGKMDLAFRQLQQVRDSVQNNQNPEVQMRLHSALGSAYYVIADFEPSLKHYLEALHFAEQLPKRRIENTLRRLDSVAKLYTVMKDPEKSMATIHQALSLAPQAHLPKTLASLSISEGIALSTLGRDDEALVAYQRALKIGSDAGLPNTEVYALINIADHYLIKKDFIKAEQYSRLAMARAEQTDDVRSIAIGKVNLGFALGGQGKIAPAVEFINAVIKELKASDAKADAEGVIGELANMYERAGMYKEALATLRQQQSLSDELFRSDRAKAVTMMQEQFNAKQREKQIELLAKENALKDADIRNRRLQLIISLLAATITVLAGAFILLLYHRVRKTNLQLQEVHSQLAFHAVRDPLTGLYNRRSFVDLMNVRTTQAEIERRAQGENNPDCLILMDIDHFKQINDTWGHVAGDSVLKEIAVRLKNAVRDTDMVLRWGGEEFLVYSPQSNPAQVSSLVERVLRAIGEVPVTVGDVQIPVTVTAGFVTLPFSDVPENVCGWEKALQIADMALYLGKAHGRNRAYGIARLLAPYEQVMPVLERDLSAAISAGMVALIEVQGPARE